jgi:hypothetical protein
VLAMQIVAVQTVAASTSHLNFPLAVYSGGRAVRDVVLRMCMCKQGVCQLSAMHLDTSIQHLLPSLNPPPALKNTEVDGTSLCYLSGKDFAAIEFPLLCLGNILWNFNSGSTGVCTPCSSVKHLLDSIRVSQMMHIRATVV